MGRAYKGVTFTRPSVNMNNRFHTHGRRIGREMRVNGFIPMETLPTGEVIFHDLPDPRDGRDRTYWLRRDRSKYTPHQNTREMERRLVPNYWRTA